jgi:hypothetical protein
LGAEKTHLGVKKNTFFPPCFLRNSYLWTTDIHF